jgi:tyrosine-protein phosphatase SIW14
MRYLSVPFKGMSAPSDAQIEQVLGLLGDSTSGPVFVHCRRGADRTGTVIACYRIFHDHWQNKDALSEAKHYGMSFIETAMQHYVKNFVASIVAATPAASASTP